MPAGTQTFCMLSSDYNVLRSKVIAMNNFIQCSQLAIVKLYNHFG